MNPPEGIVVHSQIQQRGISGGGTRVPELSRKLAHALGLCSLHGDQALLTPNVIAAAEIRELRFIAIGVLFQTFDALFDQHTESGADLESFTRSGAASSNSIANSLARA